MPSSSTKLMKVSEVADLLQVTDTRVYQLIAAGTIPSMRFGHRSIRIPEDAWRAWVARQSEQSISKLETPSSSGKA
jgi:excisionase family DNA binding protein